MAASGYTPIILLNSTTTGNTPTTSNLAVGELAINVTDGKLFFNQSGTIKVLANATYATSVSTISFGTTGLTPSTATNGVVTVAGTLNVANGGTGVTTSTGSGSNVLNTSPSLVTPDLGTPSSVTLTNATGLPISTGLSGLTTNGVAYATSTSALATGSALVFTGTNLGIGTSSPASQLQVSSSGNTPIDITSTGTGAVWTRYNTSTYYFDIGINNSAGTTFSTDAYANVLWGANNYPTVFGTNNTEKMRLTSAGQLLLGNTSSSYNMLVYGSTSAVTQYGNSTTGNGASNGLTVGLNSSGQAIFIHQQAYPLLFGTSGSTQMTLNTTGDLLLGASDYTSGSGYPQFITPSVLIAPISGVDQTAFVTGAYQPTYTGPWKHRGNYNATMYQQASGIHAWFTNNSTDGGAGNTVTFSQAMTLDNSGNLLVGTTTSPSGSGKIQAPKGLTGTPTFKVTSSGTQAVTANTLTKITNWTTSSGWDTSSSFDFTNKRYTPNVAGYYQVNTCITSGQAGTATNGANTSVSLYLNGGFYASMTSWNNGGANDQYQLGSAIVYMNGSTDYIEVYFTCSSNVNVNSGVATRFEAFLARGA